MSLDLWVAIAQLIGALGVVVSLLFVGMQIRRNTAAVRGATLQAISDTMVSYLSDGSRDQHFCALLARVFEGQSIAQFTSQDNSQLFSSYMAFGQQLENTYQQVKTGVVDATVLEGYGWRNAILRTPHFQEWWAQFGGVAVSEEFLQFFRSRVVSGVAPSLAAGDG